MPDTTPSPDDKRVFFLLRKTGLDEDGAYTLVQELQNMAAANLIARFESKLDTLNARFESRLDAQNAQIASLRWLMGLGFAALLAAAIAQLFRG